MPRPAPSSTATAATRTLITGTDFGDNIIAALPDIIGSTIGTLLGGALEGDYSASKTDADFGTAEAGKSRSESAKREQISNGSFLHQAAPDPTFDRGEIDADKPFMGKVPDVTLPDPKIDLSHVHFNLRPIMLSPG